jgi:hypothetical protein
MHPITHAELKGLKQKGGESLRDYYYRFGELRAQVHDITQREVIEAFSHGIMAKWKFQDFYKENLRNNEEFRCTVEKMITVEEKIRERFPDRNNRDNLDKQNHQNNRHHDRKCGLDNTVAVANKSKKNFKFKKFKDIENMHCIWHPQGNHTMGECRIFLDRYKRKGNKGIRKKTNKKRGEDNIEDKGF